jgi:SAM-dependent methyltransferase
MKIGQCTAVFIVFGGMFSLHAQEKSVNPGINKSFQKPSVTEFEERFEKEGREVYDKRQEVIKELGLKPGMAVADVGAGTGLYTRLLAPAVGKEGKVYAVDIAESFVEHAVKSSKDQGWDNVEGIVCASDDAKLPPAPSIWFLRVTPTTTLSSPPKRWPRFARPCDLAGSWW